VITMLLHSQPTKVLRTMDAGNPAPKPQIPRPRPTAPDALRTKWIIDTMVAMSERMTDAARIQALGTQYDLAHNDGIQVGIDRLADAILRKPAP
jgi:hypothetical protein